MAALDDGRGAPGRVPRMSAAPTRRYAGRDFTEGEIALIRDLLAADPKLTRSRLSQAFCRRVGWVKPDGGLRDMMARCALLAMHRDGLIVLPPPRQPRNAPAPIVFGPESEPPTVPPPATLEAVRPLSLVPVLDRTSHDARLWKQVIARYHYLGYTPLAGAQMRYTVLDRHATPLAMIAMGAAAWKIAPRDHAIGWSPETRARNLHLVVNQSLSSRHRALPAPSTRPPTGPISAPPGDADATTPKTSAPCRKSTSGSAHSAETGSASSTAKPDTRSSQTRRARKFRHAQPSTPQPNAYLPTASMRPAPGRASRSKRTR